MSLIKQTAGYFKWEDPVKVPKLQQEIRCNVISQKVKHQLGKQTRDQPQKSVCETESLLSG